MKPRTVNHSLKIGLVGWIAITITSVLALSFLGFLAYQKYKNSNAHVATQESDQLFMYDSQSPSSSSVSEYKDPFIVSVTPSTSDLEIEVSTTTPSLTPSPTPTNTPTPTITSTPTPTFSPTPSATPTPTFTPTPSPTPSPTNTPTPTPSPTPTPTPEECTSLSTDFLFIVPDNSEAEFVAVEENDSVDSGTYLQVDTSEIANCYTEIYNDDDETNDYECYVYLNDDLEAVNADAEDKSCALPVTYDYTASPCTDDDGNLVSCSVSVKVIDPADPDNIVNTFIRNYTVSDSDNEVLGVKEDLNDITSNVFYIIVSLIILLLFSLIVVFSDKDCIKEDRC